MTETLLDGLGLLGSALSAPGDYLRGALAGKLGERVGSKELFGLTGDDLGSELAGFAGDVATDPLTFAGGLLGGLLGKGASKAAALRGPRYGTTVEDLARMGEGYAGKSADSVADRIFQIQSVPGADRALSEIPPASTILGAGHEGLVFRTPTGDTARIGWTKTGLPGRPVLDEVNQATRAIDYPVSGMSSMRVERSPFGEHAGDARFWRTRNPETMMTPKDELDVALADSGWRIHDPHAGNYGMFGDTPKVIDPGAIESVGEFAGAFQPVVRTAEPGLLMRALLAGVGGDAATRRAVEAGMMGPNFVPSFAGIGAGAGAAGGAYGRLGG